MRLDAARVEVDGSCSCSTIRTPSEALPEVVSAERTVEGSGSAEEATKSALAKRRAAAAPRRMRRPPLTPTGRAPAGPPSAFDPVALDVHLIVPDNLVLRGKDIRPGGPTGTALGDINITVGGDMRIRKEPGGPVTLVGTVNTVRGTYKFQGRRFDLVRDGTIRFVGDADDQPAARHLRDAQDPEHRRRGPRAHHRHRRQAPQLALTSTRRSRRATSWR